MAALRIWETVSDTITEFTGVSPATFFTAVTVGFALYYLALTWFGSYSGDGQGGGHGGAEEKMEPLPPPVQVGEISDEELRQFDGSDSTKPLLMAIKGQIYDVSQSRMFYGLGGPYALFAGKDASRALAKMSFEEKDLNGDVTGLGFFELEALQDWEYKFMTKYVKVGTVKPADRASDGRATEADSGDELVSTASPQEIVDRYVAKPEEDGPSESANAIKE